MRHSLTHRDKNRRFDSGLLHKFGNTRRGRYPCTLSPGKGSDKQEVCGRYDRTGTVRQDNRGLRQTLTAGKDRRHGALVSVVTHLPSKQVSPVRIRYAPPGETRHNNSTILDRKEMPMFHRPISRDQNKPPHIIFGVGTETDAST